MFLWRHGDVSTTFGVMIVLPGLSRACPSRLEVRERFITRRAISLPQAHFRAIDYNDLQVSVRREEQMFRSGQNTDAANTPRSQLA
jgi:hypothetical protein